MSEGSIVDRIRDRMTVTHNRAVDFVDAYKRSNELLSERVQEIDAIKFSMGEVAEATSRLFQELSGLVEDMGELAYSYEEGEREAADIAADVTLHATVITNLLKVWMAHDPVTASQALTSVSPESRRVALSLLPEDVLMAWYEDIVAIVATVKDTETEAS